MTPDVEAVCLVDEPAPDDTGIEIGAGGLLLALCAGRAVNAWFAFQVGTGSQAANSAYQSFASLAAAVTLTGAVLTIPPPVSRLVPTFEMVCAVAFVLAALRGSLRAMQDHADAQIRERTPVRTPAPTIPPTPAAAPAPNVPPGPTPPPAAPVDDVIWRPRGANGGAHGGA